LGWRRALEKAGINPHETCWEVQDSLRCEICGDSVRQLGNHVAIKHQIKWPDYLAAHPGAEPIPESVRAMSLSKMKTKLPHWEPVISPEYALDRLRGWHDAGYDVNMMNIEKLDGSLSNQLRRFYCGMGHDEMLRRIGLDPTTVRRRMRPEQINRKWVIESIRDRHARNLPLSASTVTAGEFKNIPLIHHAMTLFPSWEAAVCAADLDPLAFVDDGGTPEKPLTDLAGNFHLLCAVMITSEKYLKLKAALAEWPDLLPRGVYEFHATQIVNPGRSPWKKHSTRRRLDTLTLLYQLLLQYADQILFGFVSGEQFDAEMRAQLPAELSGIKSKEALKKVFFNSLIPHLKTRSSDTAILMDSDRETENQLRIQAVADPTGLVADPASRA
ncbi:MAG: hypothetical protein NTV80_12225, partial [Verrucomicrobia bacterium]|nr:hypothetical protein [Verrucomicrobiota bacterium]